MTEAWQKREYERQQLIEGLVRKVHQRSVMISDESFYLELALVVIEYLKDRHKDIAHPEIKKADMPGNFFAIPLSGIVRFARTKAESDALIAQFLEKILVSGLNRFHSELTKQEIHNPELIFQDPSAMSDVSKEG